MLFVTLSKGKEDKYMFYTESVDKWRNTIQEAFSDPTVVVCYTWKTEAGTIMLYSTTGVCVIHGKKTKRDKFLSWFKKMVGHNNGETDRP